jgi:hypothetical protein
MREKLAIVLMLKILEAVRASGANERNALAALRGAEAMVPEADLEKAPLLAIET